MLRVLAVDDAELMLALRASFLGRAQCTVVPVRSPTDLIEQAKGIRPDAIVLTADMPDGSGSDALKQLESDTALANLPLVWIAEANATLPPAANAVLERPLTGRSLDAALQTLLDIPARMQPRRSTRICVGYFTDEVEGVGYARDLSVGGLFLRTPETLATDAAVQLIFDLPLEDRPRIRADGRIVHRIPSDPTQSGGLGVRFHRLGVRDRESVRTYVGAGPPERR